MASTAANTHLTKQLIVGGNIVTYRSLSRDLGIHVNVAKNELASYHASNASSSCATYLLSGEVRVPRKNPYDMEIDLNLRAEDDYDDYDSDDEDLELTRTKTVVVSESQLEATQAEFISPPSIHIYSLSPAHLKAAGLLCTPTLHLRAVDLNKEVEDAKDAETTTKQRNEWAKVVGKIVGDHVSFKPGKKWTVPSASKLKSSGPVVVPSKSASSAAAAASTSTTAVKKEPTNTDLKPKAVEKPKPTGKLDWSNAKTKEQRAAEMKEKKAADAKVKKEEQEKKAKKDEEMRAKKEEAKKKKEQMAKERETVKKEVEEPKVPKEDHRKRARALLSDSDSDPEPAPPPRKPTKPAAKSKGKRAAVLSSDDEEEDLAPKAKGKKRLLKGKKTESDEEREASLRAMMDSDDDQVIRVSRLSTSTSASVPPTEDELIPSEEEDDRPSAVNTDVDMEDDMDIVKPQPKKRKPKKVIPVGRNGLKKKRVEKSRMKEENGYMVTEDYSSYESVDEEDEPEPPKPKVQAKAKAKPEAKKVKKDEPSSKSKPSGTGGLKSAPSAKLKSAGSGSGSGAKGGIANFFTKK